MSIQPATQSNQTTTTTSSTNACWECAKNCETSFKCGRCFKAIYCKKECQTAHWPTHKPNCTKVKPNNTSTTTSEASKSVLNQTTSEKSDSQDVKEAKSKAAEQFLESADLKVMAEINSALLKEFGVDLPTQPHSYTRVDDFGIQIKELLFAAGDLSLASRKINGYKELFSEMQRLAKRLGFKLTPSQIFFHVRDAFLVNNRKLIGICMGDKTGAISRFAKNVQRASPNVPHAFFQKSLEERVSRNVPHAVLTSQLKSLNVEPQTTVFYAEGGNVVQMTNAKGQAVVLTGLETYFLSLFELGAHNFAFYSNSVFASLRKEEEAEIRKDIKRVQAGAEDLVKFGFLTTSDIKQDKVFEASVKYLTDMTCFSIILKSHFEATTYAIDQADYHLDKFMKPWRNGSVLLQSFPATIKLLTLIRERAKQLELTKKDLSILDKLLTTAELLNKQLSDTYKNINCTFKDLDVIAVPVPFVFFGTSPKNDEEVNDNIDFMNFLTGFSPKIDKFWAILPKVMIGDKLGKVLMESVRGLLQHYCAGIEVHFIGEKACAKLCNRIGSRSGLHCLSLTIDFESTKR